MDVFSCENAAQTVERNVSASCRRMIMGLAVVVGEGVTLEERAPERVKIRPIPDILPRGEW